MASKINIVISAQDKASAELKKTEKALDAFSSGADNSSRAARALGFAADAAKVGLLAAGAAGAAAAKFAISSAAEYEQSLNVFKSVSGATAEQMVQVAARSRELGKDLTLPGISAADAALAMVELGKAGLSVNDTMAASKGVLSLAKAGQMETAQAAEIAANALNAFGLEGKEASRVADILAAAANASSADVTDLAYSLQMSSAGAAAVKVPIDQLVASIGLMANNGIKGSDAGTSLKTMFMNLIPTTDRQRESFKQLNLDFYDAKGNFVGLREMIKQLEAGTKDLTDEQKALHIENIFGADSSRAANILLKEGVKGYDAMTNAVNKTGAAAELAAAQNAGFNGALDGLKSTIETIAIDVGMKMLPGLTDLAKTVNSGLEPSFYNLVGTVKAFGRAIGSYLGPVLGSLYTAVKTSVIPTLTALYTAVIRPIATFIGGVLVFSIREAIRALTFVAEIARPLTATLLGLGAALVTLKFSQAVAGVIAFARALDLSALAMKGFAAASVLLNLNPIVLATSALVGGLTALWALTGPFSTATDGAAGAIQRQKLAQDDLTRANRDAKLAQEDLKNAVLDQEGANLRVERATRDVMRANEEYGPNSLEAREAALELKRAQQDLADATNHVADKTREVSEKQAEVIKRKEEVKKAAEEMGSSANVAAGGFRNLANTMQDVVNKQSAVKPGTANGSNNPLSLNKVLGHATGTSYAPGGLTVVGENGPELVDMPRGSKVTQAHRARNELSKSIGGGNVYVTQNIYKELDYLKGMTEIGFILKKG